MMNSRPHSTSFNTAFFIVILLIALFFGSAPALERDTRLVRLTVNSSCMRGIGKALIQYANSNNGFLPAGAGWTDILIENEDKYPKSFLLYDQGCLEIEGESNVALNIAAAGQKLSELPSDLVLAFKVHNQNTESSRNYPVLERISYEKYKDDPGDYLKKQFVHKDWWNISCGPERLHINYFNMAALVLFANGDVRWVPFDELATLSWDQANTDYTEVINSRMDEYNAQTAEFHKRGNITILFLTAFLGVFIVLLLFKYPIRKKHIPETISFIFLTSLFGIALGFASQWVHPDNHNYEIGAAIGLIVSFTAAICFASLVLNLQVKHINHFGVFLGCVSSTIVHLALVYILANPITEVFIFGLPYGILAGYLLGWIFAKLFFEQENQAEQTSINLA